MVKLAKRKIRIFASLLFMLLMLAKSFHQLSHLIPQNNTENALDFDDHNHNHLDSCTLCAFNFSPILESSIQHLPFEWKNGILSKPIDFEPQFQISDFSITNKQLRAPPFLNVLFIPMN